MKKILISIYVLLAILLTGSVVVKAVDPPAGMSGSQSEMLNSVLGNGQTGGLDALKKKQSTENSLGTTNNGAADKKSDPSANAGNQSTNQNPTTNKNGTDTAKASNDDVKSSSISKGWMVLFAVVYGIILLLSITALLLSIVALSKWIRKN